MGVRRGVWIVAVTLGALVLVVGEAWIPVGTELVRVQREPPVRSGTFLDFQGRSVLIGEPRPDWLVQSVAAGRFELRLRFMTFWPDQSGPAQIFAISAGIDDADLVVGQDDLDLVVRVRRPGADADGTPEFRIDDALVQAEPQQLDLTIAGEWMTVALDGRVVQHVPLGGSAPVATWDPDQRVVIGDEEEGGRGWIGGIFEATVDEGSSARPLIASGDLHPGAGTVEFERPRVIDRPPDTAPVPVALRLGLFMPLGLGLGSLLRRPATAVLCCSAIVLVIAAGKLLVPSRHPSIAEIVLGIAGSAAGVALARVRRRRMNLQSDPARSGRS